jgi:hypothetical protein
MRNGVASAAGYGNKREKQPVSANNGININGVINSQCWHGISISMKHQYQCGVSINKRNTGGVAQWHGVMAWRRGVMAINGVSINLAWHLWLALMWLENISAK